MKKLFTLFISMILLASCNEKQETIDLNIMSFNVRLDTPADSLDSWLHRKDCAAQIILDRQADIVGAQEVLFHQLNDLKDRLPNYNSIGVGRQDGATQGEYSPILYNKNRFAETKSGYFWLSETPDITGSKGWDGACERVATWAILKDIKSGKELFILNTHLDHIGVVARKEGVSLLLDKIDELGKDLPVVLTGDFNAEPESDVIKHITDLSNDKHLIDTKTSASEVISAKWTYHGYGKIPENEYEYVDYIFVNKKVEVLKFEVLPEKLSDIYLSDHTPILTHIRIK